MAKTKAAEENTQDSALAKLESDTKVLGMSKRQDAVSAITNLADLTNILGQEAVQWEDIEPSFRVGSQEEYEGVPIIVAAFRLNESTKFMQRNENDVLIPGKFVSLLLAPFDENNGDIIGPWTIVNDGGTGVCRSLVRMVEQLAPNAGSNRMLFNDTAAGLPPIVAKGGFRRSDYPYEDDKGNVGQATTWYLAA